MTYRVVPPCRRNRFDADALSSRIGISDTHHARSSRSLPAANIPERHWEHESSTVILPMMQRPEVTSDLHRPGASGRRDHGLGTRPRAFGLHRAHLTVFPEGVQRSGSRAGHRQAF